MVQQSKKLNKAQDQRGHARFKSYNVIRAIGPEGREIQSESALINMSESGMLFYSTEKVKEQSNIKIHVEVPEFNSSITVGAKVMWAQVAMERPNSFFVGVQFVDLGKSDLGLIRQLKDKSENS